MKKSKIIVVLLMFVFFMTSEAFADTLESGSKGAEIEKLQLQLKKLGYFDHEVTGYFGSITETSVKNFQRKMNLTTDGIVGSSTQKVLFSQVESMNVSSQKERIKEIQSNLESLGLYNMKIDGIYGSGTIAAVRQFQKTKGLEVTGKLDLITEKGILSSVKTASVTRGSINRQVTAAKGDNNTLQAADTQSDTDDDSVNEDLLDDNGINDKNVTDNGSVDSKVEPGEYLDWWDFVNDFFSIGTVAEVIDYRTGKSFYIKRTYGKNHADSETLTKEDTAIMKELWGGNWSWVRRPVIVVVNGRRIAASVAGMPHAGRDDALAGAYVKSRSGGYGSGTNLDKIKENDMDGHFDVHFLNSRTHGTNRIEPLHQAAVREAARK